jgi:hypothetical protein
MHYYCAVSMTSSTLPTGCAPHATGLRPNYGSTRGCRMPPDRPELDPQKLLSLARRKRYSVPPDTPHESSNLTLGVTVVNGTVVIHFGRALTGLALPAESARRFAEMLAEHAGRASGTPETTPPLERQGREAESGSEI